MATEKQLLRKIQETKEKIVAIDGIYPGSVSQQYNICGTPGCKCKDKTDPVKHGPYSNLSYTFRGKSKTKFVRKELVDDFERYTANFKRLRSLVEELIDLNMQLIDYRSKKE